MQSLDFYLKQPEQVTGLTDEEQLSLYQQLSNKVKSLEVQKTSLQSQRDLLQQQLEQSQQELFALSNTTSMEQFTSYFAQLKQQFVSEQQELLKLVSEVDS